MMLATATVKLPAFHPKQREVALDPTRFKVVTSGRRWGKTRLGAALCIMTAGKGGRAWWVAPTYPVASVGWRLIHRMARQVPGAVIRQGDRMVTFPNGGEIQVRSADNPDSLRGEGLDFVVMDECAFIQEDAWLEALRPALSDRKGRAMFISTPKGRNWFWRLWQRCVDDQDHEWRGWQLPTADNPYIDPVEIEAARRGLPERIFAQEYLAEFLDDTSGVVFRRVMDAATAIGQDGPMEAHEYIIGVDWAMSRDFTVFTVFDLNLRALVHIDRFNKVDYVYQADRLKGLARRFRARQIVAESNAMGLPIIHQLVKDGLPVDAFLTTGGSKDQAIRDLALAIENGDCRIIPDPVLIGELQAYEIKSVGRNGVPVYGAPEGMHDDCVMSAAIAWTRLAAPIGNWADLRGLDVGNFESRWR